MDNIGWAIQHGIRTYDLLRGNEPYKYSLGAQDIRLHYPLISTKSGTNLNGTLDPGCAGESIRLGEDLFRHNRTLEAMTVCHQVLTTTPGQEPAKQLLRRVVDTVLGPAE
jgi:CelD/BcsL family acetyltransferase involved in cellulose biosynthesis